MVTDEAMGNYYFSSRNRFEGLPMVMNFIAIVLLLVGWLIRLFRNNAFERFYPVSRWQLFQAVCDISVYYGRHTQFRTFIYGRREY